MTDLQTYQGNPNLKRSGQPIEWTEHTVKEFAKCARDPVYFAENYMKIVSLDEGLVNFKLRDYQKEMIRAMHENRYCAFNLSRQSGKSITVCAFILWYIIFNDEPKEVAILANKGDTAREILGRIQTAYMHLPMWLQQGVTVWNKGSFELENGCKIIAAATSSDNIRGHSISICYLDECAFIDNYDEFFASVFPTISSGSDTKIIMTSTPKGLNHFYKTVKLGKEGKNGFKVIEVPWHRVPGRDDNWRRKTLDALNGDEEKFDQEFNIQFLGSSGTLIAGWKLKELVEERPIMKNQDGLAQFKAPAKDRLYAIVADVARGKGLDYSAFSVVDITTMPYDQVCTFRSNGILVADYAEVIHQTARLYNNAWVLVEINDIGEQAAWALQNDFEYENIMMTENGGRSGKRLTSGFGGSGKDFGIRTTKPVKMIGCSMLKMLIEQNQLIVNDGATINELATFSKKNNTYEAEPGCNDDLVMGLVLFAWMTSQQYFKDLSNINTLIELREKTKEEVMEDMVPFGFISDGQEDHEFSAGGDRWVMVENDNL
jgi:hypothetical protein